MHTGLPSSAAEAPSKKWSHAGGGGGGSDGGK